jgi:VIT1/CCC1 family predicted Fe2+/Mn2+ transporter
MKTENISAKIVQKYLVQNAHDLKSLGGLLVSGIISTFGVYGLIAPFFTTDGVLSSKVYTALVAFVIVLVIFDTIKRASFTKWLNSILKEVILLKKRATSYLIITILSTFFLISLDALGSWTTAELGANLYLQAKTN